MQRSHQALAAAIVLFLSAGAHAAAMPIDQVPYASLGGTKVVTFGDVAGSALPGTNYDGIVFSGGASFAERFSGQDNTPAGAFDVLSGRPTDPLALTAGPANQNLSVIHYNSSQGNVLAGLGPVPGTIGTGAVSMLFPGSTAQFGFQLIASNGGMATLDFFMRDGSLIDSIVLNPLAGDFYGFRRDAGQQDIAGISIFNNDPDGIAFDNVRYDAQAVPEPGTLALLGLGLAGLATRRRGTAS